jgi:two-component system, NarL family, response regulator LiaR
VPARKAEVTAPIRVLLAEDHAVVREGTRQLLERDESIEVVGEAADGQAAVALATELLPDVVLLDLNLPLLNGIDATKEIRALPNPPHVLILSAYDDQDYVHAAMNAGANGYLVKIATIRDIIAAIHAVSQGEVVLHPAAAQRFFAQRSDVGRGVLSARELEVLWQAARGVRNKEIGAALSLSTRTVEAYFTSIFNKLGVSTRTEAVTYAISHGWLTVRRQPLRG